MKPAPCFYRFNVAVALVQSNTLVMRVSHAIASSKYAAVNAARFIESVQVTVCGATFRYLPTNKGTFALETATHDQLAATK